MKTIKEAYEELKGDLGNCDFPDCASHECLWFNTDADNYITLRKPPCLLPEIYQYICTVEEFNNYTPAKTVLDAVVEFKGEWSNAEYGDIDVKFIFECINDDGVSSKVGSLIGDSMNHSPKCFRQVCTRDEFNTLVAELASNMGRAKQTYEEYKTYEPALTEASFPTYNAHQAISSGGDWFYGGGGFDGGGGSGVIQPCPQTEPVDWNSAEFKGLVNQLTTQKFPAKESKLDTVEYKGKVYQIGAVYEFSVAGVYWYRLELVGIDEPSECPFESGGGNYALIRELKAPVGTITDVPVKLADGKAYIFDHKDKGLSEGIYDDNGECFWVKCTPCQISHCTNIKPLTVESK